MEGNEFTIFIHGPFATGINLDAGKLSSIDDEFLREFVSERKNQIIDYRKESIPYMKGIIDGIKVVLEDYEFPEDREDDSNSTKYKFENNTIYFYECGTGLFSTRVTITFQGTEKVSSISSVKEAERFARDLVTKKFEDRFLSFTNMSFIKLSVINSMPCKAPQIINVQFAPCHKPLIKNTIVILRYFLDAFTLLPPKGIYK